MFRFQDRLPRLPVPDLGETCAFYLQLVEPLQTPSEHETTRQAVEEFMRPGGVGEELQRRLVRRRDTPGIANWLEAFWDDWYLADDTPLLINVNPGGVISGSGDQLRRAARLVCAAARFKGLVDRQELEPDMDGERPRCMFEYPRILSFTRLPAPGRDRLVTHPESRHIAVLRNGHVYAVDVLDHHAHPYPSSAVESALHQIVKESSQPVPAIGALTTLPRSRWAQLRSRHLVKGAAANPVSLQAIETAILVLVLETGASPPSPSSVEAARMALHGDARNRWFDKSIQLIVAGDGTAATCIEHSGFDGSTLRRFTDFLVEHEHDPEPPTSEVPTVKVLPFVVNPGFADDLRLAEQEADRLIARTDLSLIRTSDLGAARLRSMGIRADGFLQIAFQVAYHHLFDGTASTYESVNMKHYLHGRTEAMRSVSEDSVGLAESMAGTDRIRDMEGLLRSAIQVHVTRVRRCKEGRGVDRHLLGLRQMLEPEEESPSLFLDAGYPTLTRSVLSTSTLPHSPASAGSCFGPVVDEGFGLSYGWTETSINCAVSNFHGLAGEFARRLEESIYQLDVVAAGSDAG